MKHEEVRQPVKEEHHASIRVHATHTHTSARPRSGPTHKLVSWVTGRPVAGSDVITVVPLAFLEAVLGAEQVVEVGVGPPLSRGISLAVFCHNLSLSTSCQ